jgi:hypothetical protein
VLSPGKQGCEPGAVKMADTVDVILMDCWACMKELIRCVEVVMLKSWLSRSLMLNTICSHLANECGDMLYVAFCCILRPYFRILQSCQQMAGGFGGRMCGIKVYAFCSHVTITLSLQ